MKRSKAMKALQARWVPVEGRCAGVEIQVEPRAAIEFMSVHLGANTPPGMRRIYAAEAIVAFRGYEDDLGADLPNERQYRMELGQFPEVWAAICTAATESMEQDQGEDNAVSVSPVGASRT